ncbi:serine/threonine-protein kinase [Azospirillum sp. B4]|uniref:serine/threonine-protein kinase n=1 Tax=Azospirillum sp. B4 TaxID=95605 RepID=UPI00131F4881|nr:serine/threonine-protein kinase [Azospirillum sp. B4]
MLPYGTPLGSGRYMLGKEEGIGGYSICYRAWDGEQDRIVAIKELFTDRLASRQPDGSVYPIFGCTQDFRAALEGSQAEALMLQSMIREPGIVQYYDDFMDNNTYYIVTEFVRGSTLDDYVSDIIKKTSLPMPANPAVNVTMQLLSFVAQMHKANFLHLDLKPSNIHVREDASMCLLDLGSAREKLRARDMNVRHTLTPGYAALEQYEVDAVLTPQADIYGMGATLYHCLTGRIPPEAPRRAEGVFMLPPSALNPTVSAALDEIVDKAMALNANERYRSATEFRSALKRLALPPSLPEPPPPPPPDRAVRRAPVLRRALAGMVELFLGLVVCIAMAVGGLPQADQLIGIGIIAWFLCQILLPLNEKPTPGMVLTGLLFARIDPTKEMTLTRALSRALLITLLGGLLVFSRDKEGRLLQDRVCGLDVVVA